MDSRRFNGLATASQFDEPCPNRTPQTLQSITPAPESAYVIDPEAKARQPKARSDFLQGYLGDNPPLIASSLQEWGSPESAESVKFRIFGLPGVHRGGTNDAPSIKSLYAVDEKRVQTLQCVARDLGWSVYCARVMARWRGPASEIPDHKNTMFDSGLLGFLHSYSFQPGVDYDFGVVSVTTMDDKTVLPPVDPIVRQPRIPFISHRHFVQWDLNLLDFPAPSQGPEPQADKRGPHLVEKRWERSALLLIPLFKLWDVFSRSIRRSHYGDDGLSALATHLVGLANGCEPPHPNPDHHQRIVETAYNSIEMVNEDFYTWEGSARSSLPRLISHILQFAICQQDKNLFCKVVWRAHPNYVTADIQFLETTLRMCYETGQLDFVGDMLHDLLSRLIARLSHLHLRLRAVNCFSAVIDVPDLPAYYLILGTPEVMINTALVSVDDGMAYIKAILKYSRAQNPMKMILDCLESDVSCLPAVGMLLKTRDTEHALALASQTPNNRISTNIFELQATKLFEREVFTFCSHIVCHRQVEGEDRFDIQPCQLAGFLSALIIIQRGQVLKGLLDDLKSSVSTIPGLAEFRQFWFPFFGALRMPDNVKDGLQRQWVTFAGALLKEYICQFAAEEQSKRSDVDGLEEFCNALANPYMREANFPWDEKHKSIISHLKDDPTLEFSTNRSTDPPSLKVVKLSPSRPGQLLYLARVKEELRSKLDCELKGWIMPTTSTILNSLEFLDIPKPKLFSSVDCEAALRQNYTDFMYVENALGRCYPADYREKSAWMGFDPREGIRDECNHDRLDPIWIARLDQHRRGVKLITPEDDPVYGFSGKGWKRKNVENLVVLTKRPRLSDSAELSKRTRLV